MTDIEKNIKKEFGDNVVVDGNFIINSPHIVIPFSPNIDIITGGGIQEGTFVTVIGPDKCGKTTSVLTFLANCQKPEYGGELCPEGRDVYYYNIEGRLRSRDLLGIEGLDPNKIHIIQSRIGKILTAEDYLQIGLQYIKAKPGSVHFFDSYSELSTNKEQVSDMDKMQMAEVAKLLAKFCRQLSGTISTNRNIIIGVIQLMGNPSPFQASIVEKSGNAVKYKVDVKLRAKKHTPWMSGESQIGQIVTWQCLTSNLTNPNKSIDSYIRYGTGIDKMYELIQFASDIGVIEKTAKGGWHTLSFMENPEKIQGGDNVRKFMVDNPEVYNLLEKSVRDLLT